MARLVVLSVVLLAALQGSGVATVLAEDACETEHHESRGPVDECPPDCAACPCCSPATGAPAVGGVRVTAPASAPLAILDCTAELPPAPAPRGILHVPRARA